MIGKIIRVNWDIVGFSASFLCMLHCILLPVLITLFPMMGVAFFAEEVYELFFVSTSLLIAFIAMYNGYKNFHGERMPMYLFLIALLLFCIGFLVRYHLVERVLHFFATGFLIVTHYYNWKLIKSSKNCKAKRVYEIQK
ncbi:MerC domain-containing protein [Aquimarina sediminis]|uniref:MerC domain-containing protein n=1 Tax=Aquimarina sediminis TaxID=2070536 RepID=UPI000CA04C86|nr:MerC domain-containing protein [Aquimarina sediminis]